MVYNNIIIGDRFCSVCGGLATAVDVRCCGTVVLDNFCARCGQPAAAAATASESFLEEVEEVKEIKKEVKDVDVIYISD